MANKTAIVTPWHNPQQRDRFLAAWGITSIPPWLYLVQDEKGDGCARTKNRGIKWAIDSGYDTIVVLDDDCFPVSGTNTLDELVAMHEEALEPQEVTRFWPVTDPASRGTPYHARSMLMPVAASMGFWHHVGDYDACAQLIHGAHHPMDFKKGARYGDYFALSGMNIAFRADQWPMCQFIDVPRFDDIWMGLIWQRIAYDRRQCFNLAGPTVTHSRQSNVWANLRAEAPNMERNETLWQVIDAHPSCNYDELKALCVGVGA